MRKHLECGQVSCWPFFFLVSGPGLNHKTAAKNLRVSKPIIVCSFLKST